MDACSIRGTYHLVFVTFHPLLAHVETFPVTVTDGEVTIDFIKVTENPKVRLP